MQPVTDHRTPSDLTIRKAWRRGKERALLAAIFARRRQAGGLHRLPPGAAAALGLTTDNHWERPVACICRLVRGNLAARTSHVWAGTKGLLLMEGLGLWPRAIVLQLRQPGSWVSVGVLGGCLPFHQHDLPVRPLVIATPVGYGLAPSTPLSGRYRCRPPSPAPPRGHVGAKPNRYERSQQWITLWKGARSAPLRGLGDVCATLSVAMRNLAVDRPTQSPFHPDLDSLGTS